MQKILLTAGLLFISASSSGRIYFNDGIFPELATSSRALAMGNAYLSKVDDASAVWYNPAGLGTVRYAHLHLSNFHFESNKGHFDIIGKKVKFSRLTNGSKGEHVRRWLQKYRGSLYFSRFHAMPNLTGRFFSLGFLYSAQLQALIEKPQDALFQFSKRKDHGPYAGLNLSLMGGILKMGISGILLRRQEFYSEADSQTTFRVGPEEKRDGSILLTTAGLRLTLPWIGLPTLSAKLNNATQKAFKRKNGRRLPLSIPQSLDVGFSLTPQVGLSSRLHLEVNIRDISKKFFKQRTIHRGVANSRRMGLGAEFDFSRTFFLRFGYSDGFGSAGFGIKKKELECDLTTYATDLSNQFRGEEDRRFVLSLSKGL